MQINLLPFIIEAFGSNKKIRKSIDRCYEECKMRYYALAKESEFYNHPIITDGDILKEIYGKRALGIVLDAASNSESANEMLDIIEIGWPQTLGYVTATDTINFAYYIREFLKDRFNMTDDIFNAELTILFWLTVIFQKIFDTSKENKELVSYYENTLIDRLTFYKKQKKVSEEPMFRKRVEEEYGAIRCYDDIFLDKNSYEKRMFLDALSFIFDSEGMSISSIVSGINFPMREINEIYGAYYAVYKNQNREKALYFIMNGIILRGLIKSYKALKDYYFRNNKETVLLEMQSQKNTIEKLKMENEFLSDRVSSLETQISGDYKEIEESYINNIRELRNENKRLEEVLLDEKKKEKELFALRELLFSIEQEEDYQVDIIDGFNLDEVRGVIVGGHVKWQQRMKEILPNFVFLHVDNDNIDPSIFDNVDVVFFYTNYLSHSIYYKVIKITREKDIEVGYINTTSIDRVLNTIRHKLGGISGPK